MKHSLLYVKAAITTASIALFALASQAQYTLQLFHASDLEGGVEAIGAAPKFAAIIDTLEENYTNTLILSAGDNYISGPFYSSADARAVRDSLQKVYEALYGITGSNIREGAGRIDISIMNVIGFQASALGNHEFDLGSSAVGGLCEPDVRGSSVGDVRWVGNNFPYLSSNLDFSSDNNLKDLYDGTIKDASSFRFDYNNISGSANKKGLAPATFVTVNGERIGIVGATTPLLQRISSPGDTKVKNPGAGTNDMNALAGHIQPQIDALVNTHGCNKIILVSHLQQYQLEMQLAPLLSKVDVIVSGGSDGIFANPGDRLHGGDQAVQPYPYFAQNKDGDPVAIVSTDGQYSYVGHLVLEFDNNGKIDTTKHRSVSRPYPVDSIMVDSLYGMNYASAFVGNSKGALVKTLTDAVSSIVIAKDGNIVGKTDVFIDGRREIVRTQESNMGNLTADANLWQAQQYDSDVKVSLKNGGGIRAAIGAIVETSPGQYEYAKPKANSLSGKKEGEVSQLDLENTMKFNNKLTIVGVKAIGLRELFEHGISAWAPGATPGQMPQVGGCQFSFDPNGTAGSQIHSFVLVDGNGKVTDTIVKEGQMHGDTNRIIKLVTLDFLQRFDGDGYPFSKVAQSVVYMDTISSLPAGNFTFAVAGSEQDAMAEYLNNNYAINPFEAEETPIEDDQRIQILSLRADKIFPVTIEFDETLLESKEDAGTITVDLNYNNTTSSNASVNVRVNMVSTATEGTDFTVSNKSFTANAGASGTFQFDIVVTDDSDSEEDEYIVLEVDPAQNHDLEAGHMIIYLDDNDRKAPTPSKAIELKLVDSFDGLNKNGNSTEIIAYDAASKQLYVANSSNAKVEILDFSNPDDIKEVKSVDVSSYGEINSVAVHNGIVACAMAASNVDDPGKVVFLDKDGTYLNDVTVGVLPDMVTFTHDGKKAIAACEGEPNDDYDIDPEGSIAIVDLSNGVASATAKILDFNSYDSQRDQLLQQGVRIFGNYGRATVSQDMEPEYVTVSADNKTAWVACQENNALVIVDLTSDAISDIKALGTKDHSASGNGLDAVRDHDTYHISNYPVKGFYHPDAIASYAVGGKTYVVTANEGDSRDYDGYSEEARFEKGDLVLDPQKFPNPDMMFDLISEIKITLANGDTDGDGDYDEIYTYGARSFSIWDGATGNLVWDSGNEMEQISSTHPEYHPNFNNDNDPGIAYRNRSDDKGPEPEAVVVAELSGKQYAFVGAERSGGIYVYDVTNPMSPTYVDHHNPRDTATGDGDLGPEGLVFIPNSESPTKVDYLVVANEVSSTISVYHVFDAQLDTTTTAPVGIAGLHNDNDVVIYPNPSNGRFKVSANGGNIVDLELVDMKGTVVKQYAGVETNEVNLDITAIEGQLFILNVTTENGVTRKPIIKQ